MKNTSAIILAGGKSSRMGTDKALLPYRGTTLLEWQIRKLRSLGIEDIMLSGRREWTEGVRCIEDEFPDRGPLGGLHACLKQAVNPSCLVITVDTPLVPESCLTALVREHHRSTGEATILRHGERTEPLIGVYDSRLYSVAETVLMGENRSVRRLLSEVEYKTFCFTGDDSLFFNCNTPNEYERLCSADEG